MASMGGGAALGLAEVLRRKFLEAQLLQQAQIEQARLAEDARQADQGFNLGLDKLGIDRSRVSLDRDEFGFKQSRAAEDDKRYAAEAPLREADVAYKGALTGKIIREPQDTEAERAYQATRDKTMHGYRLGEINARSGDSRASDWQIVQSVNPQTNETVSVRVNRQTGEAQPVSMPGGLQPGGARQTRLSAGQQDDLATMDTVQQLGQQALQLGESIKWEGVGGLGAGTIGQFAMKNFGMGNQKSEELRNIISNVQGTIAKLRGGTSFTTNEQKLLDSYTPTINDSAAQIKAKLSQLDNFIRLKRESTLKYAGAPPQTGGPAQKTSDPLGIR